MNAPKHRLALAASATVIAAGLVGFTTLAQITGTPGDDRIDANFEVDGQPRGTTDGDDQVDGLAGDDRIYGLAGNDQLVGGEGRDSVYGNEGDDALVGGMDEDFLDGGPGNDGIDAGDFDDEVKGGGGSDTIAGGPGNDDINGGPGNSANPDGPDSINGNDGDDTILGGNGNDTLLGNEGADDLRGNADDDSVNGGGGNDVLYGDLGNDVLQGEAGNDTLYGGQNNDTLFGGAGDDLLITEPGQYEFSFDYFDGNEGADVLFGGGGTQVLIGRDDNDTLIAGPGDDYFVLIGATEVGNHTLIDAYEDDDPSKPVIDGGTDALFFARDINPDQITQTDTQPVFYELNMGLMTDQPITLDMNSLPATAFVEVVITGSAADTVTGTDLTGHQSYRRRFLEGGQSFFSPDELFFTGPGNDTIVTGAGDDLVSADAGDDDITLGTGQCNLILGPGRDTVRQPVEGIIGFSDLGGGDGIQRRRILDLRNEDVLLLEGNVTVDQISVEDQRRYGQTRYAQLMLDGEPIFEFWAVRAGDIELTDNNGNGVMVKVKPGPDVAGPPQPIDDPPAQQPGKR
ncbi:MAG: calcium-binding protein [Planctomycetota bacterium]